MQRGGGVAYFAHIGGFVAGLVIIQLLGGQRLVARQRVRTAYYPPPPESANPSPLGSLRLRVRRRGRAALSLSAQADRVRA